ncbi:restriction endonuclease subunit S [Flavobacteriaceae bacterium]|nr:restriction endonuclease subunit S [Flavobacteriaceae bacterium]
MDMITENKVVPNLRFREFNDSWEKKKLGDVGKVKMCKRIFSNQTTKDGEIPFYKIGTFGKKADAFIDIDLYNEFKLKYSYPKDGEILMSASGTLGKTVVFNGTPSYYQDSNIVWLANNEELITNYFLFYIYQIVRYDSEGGTIQRLYNSIILNTKFYKPSLPEQQKIASFLSSVDEKLQQLSKKKELLEDYKKGIMQKIFSQEIRFKDDNGNNYPNWEKKRLEEVIYFFNGKGHEQDVSSDGLFIIVNSKFISTNGKVKKYTNLQKCPLQKDNIVMVMSDVPNGKALAKCYYIEKDNLYSLNQRICSLKQKSINMRFLFYLLNRNKYFLKFDSGVGQTNIKKSEVLSCPLYIPSSIKEQQSIAEFFTEIDKKIEFVSHQLEKTKEFKKGLLQQMFV